MLTSLLAAILIAGFLFLSLPTLLGSVFASAGESDPQQGLKTLLARHEEDQKLYMDRINGRSLFVKPKLPPPPPPPARDRTAPTVPQEPKDTGPPPIPKAPATYGGPEYLFPVGQDAIQFRTGSGLTGYFTLRIGEPPQEGVEVLEVNAPRSVKLAWTKPGHERGLYTISMIDGMNFDGDHKGLSDKPLTQNKPQPGIVDASKAAAPPATNGVGEADSGDLSDDPDESSGDEVEDDSEDDGGEDEEGESGGEDPDDDAEVPERNV